MSRIYQKVTVIVTVLLYSFTVYGNLPSYNVYLKELGAFKKQVCQSSDQAEYQELLKAYRSSDFYLPKRDKNIDLISLRTALPVIDKKIDWIDSTTSKLQDLVKSNKIGLLSKKQEIASKELENVIKAILKTRYSYHVLSSISSDQYQSMMNQHIILLKKTWGELSERLFYLKNAYFPIDHLKNRSQHDSLSSQNNLIKKNILYTLRKIYEDGTFDKTRKYSDKSIRSVFDTLEISISQLEGFKDFDESLRADLTWFLNAIENFHKKNSYSQIISRLQDWQSRSKKHLDFYRELILLPPQKRRQLAAQSITSQDKISSFNDRKQVQTYKYWAGKSEQLQKAFVLDTILIHEVGHVDPVGLEREDVVKVVFNRSRLNPFNILSENQKLAVLLKNEKVKSNQPWLNTLLRKGEFSFTYFYIPSSYHIYCPDIYDSINRLREDNYKIFQKIAKENDSPKLIGYFSRVSMNGRINMSGVWSHWSKAEQRPGLKISEKKTKSYKKKMLVMDFDYFYSFDYAGETFDVFSFSDKTVVGKRTSPIPVPHQKAYSYEFFTYRDPDFFRFFKLKK